MPQTMRLSGRTARSGDGSRERRRRGSTLLQALEIPPPAILLLGQDVSDLCVKQRVSAVQIHNALAQSGVDLEIVLSGLYRLVGSLRRQTRTSQHAKNHTERQWIRLNRADEVHE